MKTIRILLAAICLSASVQATAQTTSTFVFAKINDPIMPIDRGDKYEDPLDAALKQSHLGEVTGGGTSLTKEKTIEWVGVDIELADVERGIPFVKRKLRQLGAPKGSTLEYELRGKKISTPVHD